jgi:hypothetical protein
MPVVIGIVYMSLGIKVVLSQVALVADGEEAHFSGAALVGLYGGAALYLLAMSAVRWRDIGSPNVARAVVAAVLVAVGAGAEGVRLTALVNLAIVATILVGLVTYEVVRHRDVRARIRQSA